MVKATFRDFCATCVYGYPHVSYAQQTRKDLFDKTLPTYLVNNGLPNFLFGDFNTVIDLQDRHASNRELSFTLRELVRGLQLVDTFRRLHPNTIEFSFMGHRGRSRIDHIYVPKEFGDKILECKHVFYAAVVARLDMGPGTRPSKRKSAFWRMKASSLQNPELVELLGSFVNSCERKLIKYGLPRIQWWEETIKPGIRKIVRDFDVREASKRKRHLDMLHRQYEGKKATQRRGRVLESLLS